MSSDAFRNVLASPGSVSARQRLAAEWRVSGDPRAELLERQLRLHERNSGYPRLSYEEQLRTEREVDALIAANGRAWAGRIAELADAYSFRLGLVNDIDIRGDLFVAHAKEITASAPILHLCLVLPIDFDALCKVAELQQLRSLVIAGFDRLGDREAMLLANCPYLRNLLWGSWGNNMHEAGLRAIAHSPYLQNIVYLDVTRNPGAEGFSNFSGNGLRPIREPDSITLIGSAAQRYLDRAADESFRLYTYSGHSVWPPDLDEETWTE